MCRKLVKFLFCMISCKNGCRHSAPSGHLTPGQTIMGCWHTTGSTLRVSVRVSPVPPLIASSSSSLHSSDRLPPPPPSTRSACQSSPLVIVLPRTPRELQPARVCVREEGKSACLTLPRAAPCHNCHVMMRHCCDSYNIQGRAVGWR